MTMAVKVHPDIYLCLLCLSSGFCDSLASKKMLGYLIPCHFPISITNNECFAAKILCQLAVCFPVTYDIAVLYVVLGTVEIFCQHSYARLAAWMVILGEMSVDMYL